MELRIFGFHCSSLHLRRIPQNDPKNHMIHVRCLIVSRSNVTKRTSNLKKHTSWVCQSYPFARQAFRYQFATKLLIFVRQTIENLIRGLDDDEVDFLSIVDKAKMDAERRQQNEDNKEMREFRERVATLQENTIDQVCVGVIYRIYAGVKIYLTKKLIADILSYFSFPENQHREGRTKSERLQSVEQTITEVNFGRYCPKANGKRCSW